MSLDEVPRPLQDWLIARDWHIDDGLSVEWTTGVVVGYGMAPMHQQLSTLRGALSETQLTAEASESLLREAEATGQATLDLADGWVSVRADEVLVAIETTSATFHNDCKVIWDPEEIPPATQKRGPLALWEKTATRGGATLAEAVLDELADLAHEATKHLPIVLADAAQPLEEPEVELDFDALERWWRSEWPEDPWEDAAGAVAAEMWLPPPQHTGDLPKTLREADERSWWRDVLRPACSHLVDAMIGRDYDKTAELLLSICDAAEAAGAFYFQFDPVAIGEELAQVPRDIAAVLPPEGAAALEVRAEVLRTATPRWRSTITLEPGPDLNTYDPPADRRGRIRYHLGESSYDWYADAHDLPDDVIVINNRTITSNPATGRYRIETFESAGVLIEKLQDIRPGTYRIKQQ